MDPAVARSPLAARLRNGPKVTEFAAERHDPELAELLDRSLRAQGTEDDPVKLRHHAIVF